jgi:hypothetical protein
VLLAAPLMAFCQNSTVAQSAAERFVFGLGDIRPKFFQVRFSTLPNIQDYPYGEYRDVEKFETNRLIDAKLTVPLVLVERLKLLVQLRYKNELLNLGEIKDVYDRDLNLKNTGLSLLYKVRIGEHLYAAGHFAGSLKADSYMSRPVSAMLDYNSSFVLLWEHNSGSSQTGMGVVTGNTLGRFNILPVLIFDRRINDRWFLEMKLPKRAVVRRVIHEDGFYLLFAVEGNGAAYAISDELYPGESDLEFRRASVDISIGLEKEIHDWLWFGVQVGATQPLRSVLVRRGLRSSSSLHHLSPGVAPYASISVFAVPPRSLFSRTR